MTDTPAPDADRERKIARLEENIARYERLVGSVRDLGSIQPLWFKLVNLRARIAALKGTPTDET